MHYRYCKRQKSELQGMSKKFFGADIGHSSSPHSLCLQFIINYGETDSPCLSAALHRSTEYKAQTAGPGTRGQLQERRRHLPFVWSQE